MHGSSILLLKRPKAKRNKKGKQISTLYFENTTDIEIPPKNKLEALASWIIQSEKQPDEWDISIVYINNIKMTELNKRHLSKDSTTDVISFNLTDEHSDNPEGEIYISVEQAQYQAVDYGVTTAEEIIRLTAHGILHLFGYEDDTQKKRKIMSHLEEKAIDYFQNHNF